MPELDQFEREFKSTAFLKMNPKKSAKGKAKGNRIGTNTNAVLRKIKQEELTSSKRNE